MEIEANLLAGKSIDVRIAVPRHDVPNCVPGKPVAFDGSMTFDRSSVSVENLDIQPSEGRPRLWGRAERVLGRTSIHYQSFACESQRHSRENPGWIVAVDRSKHPSRRSVARPIAEPIRCPLMTWPSR
jgi:hypothetical protein